MQDAQAAPRGISGGTGLVGRVRSAIENSNGSGWLLALPVAFLLVFLALPLLAVLLHAISELGFGGFLETASDKQFLDTVKRTAVMALIVTAICWPIAVVYSLAMAMSGRALRWFLLGALLLTFWISILVRTYGWVLLIQPSGVIQQGLEALGLLGEDGTVNLLGTAQGMYPAMVHVMLPFMVLPIYAALNDLDPRVVRAAQSLGAKPLRILRTVILPALRTGSIAGCTLVFIISLGFFITPEFLGGPSAETIATLIDREFREQFNTGYAAAMGSLLIVFVLAFYVLVTKLFKVDLKVGGD